MRHYLRLSLLAALLVVLFAEGATSTVLLVRHYSDSAINQYLLDNPKVIIDAVERYRAAADIANRHAQDQLLGKYAAQLEQDPASPAGGNPSGTHVAVEFFDYQCPYCKALAPTLDWVLQSDHEAKIVYKELPIEGDISEFAARAALAASKLGRHDAFHHALLSATGPLTAQRIRQLAKQAGLSWSRVSVAMKDPDIDAEIKRNKLLAQALSISGTPTLIIDGKYVKTGMSSSRDEILRLLVTHD